MHAFMARYWWVFLVRGLFAIGFGILALAVPKLALTTLVLVWGVYAFADGLVALFAAFTGRVHGDDRWLVGLQGLIGFVAGLVTFANPAITALGLLMFIAAWSIAIGVLQIYTGIKLRNEITGEFWLELSGFISVVFGFWVMARPGAGALAVIWLIASFAILFGITMIAFAFKMKTIGQLAR